MVVKHHVMILKVTGYCSVLSYDTIYDIVY